MPKLASLATIIKEKDKELFDEVNTAKQASDNYKPPRGCRYQEEISKRKQSRRSSRRT